MTIRICMWSGPRNISTAMMRSWENRPDCTVVDEPFYACYLLETGLPHPGREDVIASQSTDRAEVIRQITEQSVATPLFYQKHMTKHMPAGMDMGWCAAMRHCFLIRDPAEVIASYLKKMPSVDEHDIGIARQAELFREISAVTGNPPCVIDAADVLDDPGAALASLCDYLGVDFLPESMLCWPPGHRESDGVWAPHWYGNVERSTGFKRYHRLVPGVPEKFQSLCASARTDYEWLSGFRPATG
ncbi:MAG: hypothetical protein OXQ29_01660 [Rhodospirillaceae bacterium]|nr:hypothetical protein [Rhodospirillaceae bacterium]